MYLKRPTWSRMPEQLCVLLSLAVLASRAIEVCEGVLLVWLSQACVHNLEEALVNCKRIGYPIMLKASWGGGGKGIRKVWHAVFSWKICH